MNSKGMIPTVLVIFGATGDLMARMVTPALFRLITSGLLPENFHIIASTRRDFTNEDYYSFLENKTKMFGNIPSDADMTPLFKRITHHNGSFDDLDSYKSLSLELTQTDKLWNMCANKLFYLPIPPEYYPVVLENLSRSGLTDPCSPDEGWTRVLVEKPFGKNLETAQQLDEKLGKLFEEEQIYRIDHYLAKETVQNILSFRFSNNIFSPSLNNTYVTRIHLRLLETLGIEDRGAFFDGIGSLRDVGANHLLQLASLLMMERPQSFDADHIRQARTDFFKSIRKFSQEDIKYKTKRSQYSGYTDLDAVPDNSQTETYFHIELESDLPQWKGVPIILEGGKKMEMDIKDITVYYKDPVPSYRPPGESSFEDYVRFDVSDEEKIELSLMFKDPAHDEKYRRDTLHYHTYTDEQKTHRIEEYELVLLDAIKGEQMRFVSTEEVKAMWEIIDPIVEGWERGDVELEKY